MTYDMAVEQKQSRMRPPTTERQDFKFAETFEGYNKRERKSSSGTSIFFAFFFCVPGQMLISALLSTIDDDHYIRLLLTNNDLKFLLGHFVNFFLNMGIIRPVEEGNGSDNFMVIPLTKREPLAENQ